MLAELELDRAPDFSLFHLQNLQGGKLGKSASYVVGATKLRLGPRQSYLPATIVAAIFCMRSELYQSCHLLYHLMTNTHSDRVACVCCCVWSSLFPGSPWIRGPVGPTVGLSVVEQTHKNLFSLRRVKQASLGRPSRSLVTVPELLLLGIFPEFPFLLLPVRYTLWCAFIGLRVLLSV
jgi:hypothetical protein